ncbi:MAG TPA: HEAT repeat domain-containing protein [Vicinamibacterales bacterium]|nr:HEAT repeat domain-containing protein [Vicinamibacterales bacterium]
MNSSGRLGVLTTNAELIVLSIDDWLSAATSISPEAARGRPLAELFPSLEQRGLVERFRETIQSGVVQVLTPALNGAVFPCPPLSPSAHFEVMQQRVTVGPLLDAERVAGLIITVQDVTPELDAERDLSEALASDSDDRRRAAAAAIAASARQDSDTAVPEDLHSDDWRVRRAAVNRLASAADADLLQAVLETLQRHHRSFSTLSSALRLLAVTDVDITRPLSQLLQNDDVDLRMQAALALGEQHHPAAVPPLLSALDDPDTNVRFHAIEALGRLRADSAVDRLIAIAASGDFFLGFAALEALALIGDSRIAPRLVEMLAVEEFRDAAADALSRLGDERAIVPLVDMLNHSEAAAAPIARAIAAIGTRLASEELDVSSVVRQSVSASGRQHLLRGLAAEDEHTRIALARVLGWIGGTEGLGALRTLLHDPLVRTDAVAGLVRIGEPAVEVLVDALSSEDQELRTASIAALGAIGSRRATPALITTLEDPAMSIGVCGALAKIGDVSAFEPLLGLLSHPQTAVRLAAIGALNSIGHDEMPARIKVLIEDSDPVARESAVRIAGYFGYPAVIDAVLARAGDREERVRIAALEHLPFLDDDGVVGLLDSALQRDSAKARAAAARALARVDPAGAVPLLVRALGDSDLWVRYFAARSLGQQRDGAPLPELLALAEHDPAEPVRVAALEAIGARRAAPELAPLTRCAREENTDVAAAALFTLGCLGGDEAMHMLRTAARNSDPSRRKAAIHGLAAMATEEAVSALAWLAAADADPSVVEAAIQALTSCATARGSSASAAVDSLVGLLADTDRSVAALAALPLIPPALIDRVARGLNHVQPNVRRRTVDALARYRRPEATRFLEAALADEDPRVRETAAVAIARLGTRMFDQILGRLAQGDPSKAVRRASAEALATVRRPD